MAENKSFEKSIARLEEIVSLLEKENTPLDDALKLYEEGIELVRYCNDSLQKAEQKIKMVRVAKDGETTVEENATL